MAQLNAISLVGRLTEDPKSGTAGENKTAYCRINICSEYIGKSFGGKEGIKEVLYISATLWGDKIGQMQSLKKGQEVFVSGRLKMQEKDKVKYWSIVVETLMYNQRLEEFPLGKQFTSAGDLEEVEELPF